MENLGKGEESHCGKQLARNGARKLINEIDYEKLANWEDFELKIN